MVEKISLARRMFEFNRRCFLESHPGAKSAFRCPSCEYPVLIERDEIGFHAQCACIEFSGGSLCPVPENAEHWEERLKIWERPRQT
jgi:hypothetical protein